MERPEEERMRTEDIAAGRGERPAPREGEHGASEQPGAQPGAGAPGAEYGAGQEAAGAPAGGGAWQPQSPVGQAGHEQPGGVVGGGVPQGGGAHDPHGAGAQGGAPVAQAGAPVAQQTEGGAPGAPGGVATEHGAGHAGAGGGAAGGAPAGAGTPTTAGHGAGESALLADNDAREFERRWQDVQVGFVDEPQRCVQEADGLVAEVMQRLADGFARERKDLESQWASGGEASTEDLRVALQRYRSFFNRLLETS
jgi:hypothetical protein